MEEIFVQLQNVTKKFTEYYTDVQHAHNPEPSFSSGTSFSRDGTEPHFLISSIETHRSSYHTPTTNKSTPISTTTDNSQFQLSLPSYTKHLEDGLPVSVINSILTISA